jgi:hypothetical protein
VSPPPPGASPPPGSVTSPTAGGTGGKTGSGGTGSQADENSAHIYFAVPLSGSSDPFSGQYLRLETYVGVSEQPHLPASLPPATDLVGIAISSTGYFLVNVLVGLTETFGKALTEAVSGADHTITIEKGDWTLIAKEGEIKIEATNTGTPSTMSFISTGSDVHFKALSGKSSTSDKYDIKESTTNTVTFILGFEYSNVTGALTKENVGFVMNINVVGDLSVKAFEIKAEIIALKYTMSSNNFYLATLKFQLISWKFGIIDSKTMIIYNKINGWQIYLEMMKNETAAFNEATKGLDMKTKIATMKLNVADAGIMQLIKM